MDARSKPENASEFERLAALGALAGPISHEFNNFLNAVVLQIAVLQQRAPETVREDLADLRRQGKRMASLIQRWQLYRQRQQPIPQPVDLNQIVRDEVTDLCQPNRAGGSPLGERDLILEGTPAGNAAPDAVTLALDLAPNLPPMSACPTDLRVLLRFLVTNAAAAIPDRSGRVMVRSGLEESAVLLTVADTGPAVPPERLPSFFDPFEEIREGPNSLELFAGESLVRRRLQGRMEVQNGSQGGVEILVRLPR